MSEARDRLERPVNYAAIFAANRRRQGVVLDEEAAASFEHPVQRLPSGSRVPGSLIGQSRTEPRSHGGRRASASRTRSPLPSYWPRRPMGDITHILRLVDRHRRRAGLRLERETPTQTPTTHQQPYMGTEVMRVVDDALESSETPTQDTPLARLVRVGYQENATPHQQRGTEVMRVVDDALESSETPTQDTPLARLVRVGYQENATPHQQRGTDVMRVVDDALESSETPTQDTPLARLVRVGYQENATPHQQRLVDRHRRRAGLSLETPTTREEEEGAGFITPQKQLLNCIEMVGKIVTCEIERMQSDPEIKRVEREKVVKHLVSLR